MDANRGGRGFAVRVARAVIAAALLAFPRSFRERHGADALRYFEDRARRGRGALGLIGLVALTVRNVADILAGGLAQRRAEGAGSVITVDVSQGLRSLRRNPRFAAAAALPIGLGVAGVTAVFAVVDGVLLRPLPYPEPDALVKVGRPLKNGVLAPISTANLMDLEGRAPALAAVGGVVGGSTLLRSDDGAELVSVTRPTQRFMSIFHLTPALGRPFVPDDFHAPEVALVSWDLWQRRWGGAPDVVGTVLDTEFGTFRIVGVLPRTWSPPEALRGTHGDLWLPLDYDDPLLETTRAFGFSSGVARLAPGATTGEANDQLHAAALALAEEHPSANVLDDGTPRLIEARSLHAETVGDIGDRLALLLGAVAALLAIGCANVANLFLARGADRRREMALRTVMGAGRGRLVVQLLTESVVVALVGGLVGLALAAVSVDALVALTPDLPRAGSVAVDFRVVAVSVALALASGVAFGVLPAWSSAKTEPGQAIRRSGQGRASGQGVRAALVVGQIALTLVLVTGGGLLVNSVVRLSRVELGFRPDRVLYLRPRLAIRTPGEQGSSYFRTLARLVGRVPGVSSVSGSMFLPGEGRPLSVDVTDPRTGEVVRRLRHTVLPGLFETMGIPLLEGRDFAADDGPDDPRFAVVSQSLAEALWPGESAVGRTFDSSDGRASVTRTVIGVVGDIRSGGAQDPPAPLFYENFYQDPWLPSMAVVLRVQGDAGLVVPALRDAARATDPSIPVLEVGLLTDLLGQNTVQQRHYALLLSLFSALALGIAAVGVYATMSYAVSARLREMGIRRAVGAHTGDVLSLILRRALTQAGAGVALGLVLALMVSRFLKPLLFGVTPADPVTYVVVGTGLMGVALVACLGPARRALRVHPVAALRQE